MEGGRGGKRGREILNSWKVTLVLSCSVYKQMCDRKCFPLTNVSFFTKPLYEYNLFFHWTSLHAVHEHVFVHHRHRFIWGREFPRTHRHVENTTRVWVDIYNAHYSSPLIAITHPSPPSPPPPPLPLLLPPSLSPPHPSPSLLSPLLSPPLPSPLPLSSSLFSPLLTLPPLSSLPSPPLLSPPLLPRFTTVIYVWPT